MATTRVTTKERLLELLSDLNYEAGCDQAAMVENSQTSSVQFLVCTEPDADWWWLNDKSGDQWKYKRYRRVDEIVVPAAGVTVFFPEWAVLPLAEAEARRANPGGLL